MIGGGTGPADGTNATTCTPGPWNLAMMLKAAEEYPMNLGFLGKGNCSDERPLEEQIKAGAMGLKIHEDWGATPAVINHCLNVADEYDVPVAIHTDTLNEAGCVEDTIASEDVLHDMGIFSMMSSDSQAMGRVGEVITRTWQTAHKMKIQKGALPEDEGHGNDNFRAKRYIAKYTINPAITHGISEYVGSVEKGKFADLVLWNPAFFGSKPDIIIKGGMIIASKMGDANASIPTTEPIMYRHMFGAHGLAKKASCITFVSKAAYEADIKNALELNKVILPIKNCRSITKKNMVFNDKTPSIDVDPETYEVKVDGTPVTSEPADKLPLTQLYNLF